VKQESTFYYCKTATYEQGHPLHFEGSRIELIFQPNVRLYDNTFSAFTVAELGEMLPEYIDIDKVACHFAANHAKKSWGCWYEVLDNCAKGDVKTKVLFADTEADARAKMLIYLIANSLITT
jgi:hypothetical protein